MRNFLLFLFVVCLCGCNKPDSKVAEYLNEKEPNITSLEVMQETVLDSILDPHDGLVSLSEKYLNAYSTMNEYARKGMEAKSKKNSILYLDSALAYFQKDITQRLDSAFLHYCLIVDYPASPRANYTGKAIITRYKLNGQQKEQLFYLGENGETIVRSASDNMTIVENIMSEGKKIRESRDSIYKNITDIESNKLRLDSWK